MNRTSLLRTTVFLAGLAAIAWVAAGYWDSNWLALAVTLLIGAFYVAGALELHRGQQATARLWQALATAAELPQTDAALRAWLERLPAALRPAVRLRIEGERAALPGPALAPYITGLLVLLGMLGTFLGMVATLHGTGSALEGAVDLTAMRATLAAPVKGLSVAFGTSLAGIAGSAALGLLQALCRRERLQAGQALDACAATQLRGFSRAHQREQSLQLLQAQSQLMPALVDRLDTLMARLEQHHQQLGDGLLAGQQAFHAQADAAYSALAASVGRSLNESLSASVRAAGALIEPTVERTLTGMAGSFERGTQGLVSGLSAQLQTTVAELTQRLDATLDGVTNNWRAALAQHQQVQAALTTGTQQALGAAASAFDAQATTLLGRIETAQQQQQDALAIRDAQRLHAWTESLRTQQVQLGQQWQQAGAQSLAQQQHICATLEQTAQQTAAHAREQASATLAEIGQLVQAAAEAPRAAAELMAEMRQQQAEGLARDNTLLHERADLLQTLETLLGAVNHAATEQRGAIDALVAGSAELLQRVGAQFVQQVQAQTGELGQAAAHIHSGAVEVASLGEALGAAVEHFGQANTALVAQLQRIEAALGQTMARSDEQLAYYVAQAREVVDLSVRSQQQILDDLQRIASTRAGAGARVEANAA